MLQKVLCCEIFNPPPEEAWGFPVFSAVTDEVALSLLEDPACIAVVVELGIKDSPAPEGFEDQGLMYAYLVCFAPDVARTAMKFWPNKVKPEDVNLNKSGIPWAVIFSSDDYSPVSLQRIAREIALKFRAEVVVYTGSTGNEEMFRENQARPTLQ